MKYQLYKDGFGWAVYAPNDGQTYHMHNYLEATEGTLDYWSDVLGPDLLNYHQIPRAAEVAKLMAQSSNAEVSDRRAHAPDNTIGANGGSLH